MGTGAPGERARPRIFRRSPNPAASYTRGRGGSSGVRLRRAPCQPPPCGPHPVHSTPPDPASPCNLRPRSLPSNWQRHRTRARPRGGDSPAKGARYSAITQAGATSERLSWAGRSREGRWRDVGAPAPSLALVFPLCKAGRAGAAAGALQRAGGSRSCSSLGPALSGVGGERARGTTRNRKGTGALRAARHCGTRRRGAIGCENAPCNRWQARQCAENKGQHRTKRRLYYKYQHPQGAYWPVCIPVLFLFF